MLAKKANGAVVVLVIVIILIIMYWIVNLSFRECSSDKDCGADRYCGSDFKCHEKIINRVEYNLTGPAAIIGLAIIIAAIILKWRRR